MECGAPPGNGLEKLNKKEIGKMSKSFDVVALGELLIDFTGSGKAPRATACLKPVPAVRPAMCWLCCGS